MTWLHSPDQTHYFVLCFYTSPSEIIVLGTNSSQNIKLALHVSPPMPNLRTVVHTNSEVFHKYSCLVKTREKYSSCRVIPMECRLLPRPHQPWPGPLLHDHCTPFPKPRANTASLPSNPYSSTKYQLNHCSPCDIIFL